MAELVSEEGALDRAVRGRRGHDPPRACGAPDHRTPERVLAVDPRSRGRGAAGAGASSGSGWSRTLRSAAGFLTGAIRSREQLAAGDFRLENPRFDADNIAANLAIVERVDAIARRCRRHARTGGPCSLLAKEGAWCRSRARAGLRTSSRTPARCGRPLGRADRVARRASRAERRALRGHVGGRPVAISAIPGISRPSHARFTLSEHEHRVNWRRVSVALAMMFTCELRRWRVRYNDPRAIAVSVFMGQEDDSGEEHAHDRPEDPDRDRRGALRAGRHARTTSPQPTSRQPTPAATTSSSRCCSCRRS